MSAEMHSIGAGPSTSVWLIDELARRAASMTCASLTCMPWRPPADAPEARDSRLDPYRDRAAVLRDEEGVFATIYVRVETYWRRVGGHLWWRRWADPHEVLIGVMDFEHDGMHTDWLTGPEHLDEELEDWGSGRFRYVGETYRLEWLDDEATRQVREYMRIDPPPPRTH